MASSARNMLPFKSLTFAIPLLFMHRETGKLAGDVRKTEGALKKYAKLKKTPKGDCFQEALKTFCESATAQVELLQALVDEAKKNAHEVRLAMGLLLLTCRWLGKIKSLDGSGSAYFLTVE